MFDAIVIGGGFYGATVANYLVEKRRLSSVLVLEREPGLMRRASLRNQARVHSGYHYPRSFTTAFRSRVNMPRFAGDYPGCIVRDFLKLYAVARRNSKISARQFKRFCGEIGAKLDAPPVQHRDLFDRGLIEEVFQVEEYAFDSSRLAQIAFEKINRNGIELRLNQTVSHVSTATANGLDVKSTAAAGESLLRARFVFNCTYSGLNQFAGDYQGTKAALKHEITEMALIQMPGALRNIGITVVDGPFFSAMPYPTSGVHSLSHVRYTPHSHWADAANLDPDKQLQRCNEASRADWMLRDAVRYVPARANARYVDSIFEVKTVLAKSEIDDSRPILFEQHAELPGCYSILGGKIDNIYDVLERLDREPL